MASSGRVDVVTLAAVQTLTNKTVRSVAGSVGTPGFQVGSAAAGLYAPSAGVMGIVAGAVETVRVSSVGARFGTPGAATTNLEISKADSAGVWDQAVTPLTVGIATARVLNGYSTVEERRPGDLAPFQSALTVGMEIPVGATTGGPLSNPRPAQFSSAIVSLVRIMGSGLAGVAGYFQTDTMAGAGGWAINTLVKTHNGFPAAVWSVEANAGLENPTDTYRAYDSIGDSRIALNILTNDFQVVNIGANTVSYQVQPLGHQSTVFPTATINAASSPASISISRAVIGTDFLTSVGNPFLGIIVSSAGTERVYITAGSGAGPYTATRAQEGTVALTHPVGTGTIFFPAVPYQYGFYSSPGAARSGLWLDTIHQYQWNSPSQDITLRSRSSAGAALTTKILSWIEGSLILKSASGATWFQDPTGAVNQVVIDAAGLTTALVVAAASITATGSMTASVGFNANTTGAIAGQFKGTTLNVTGAATVGSVASSGNVTGTTGTFSGAVSTGALSSASVASAGAISGTTHSGTIYTGDQYMDRSNPNIGHRHRLLSAVSNAGAPTATPVNLLGIVGDGAGTNAVIWINDLNSNIAMYRIKATAHAVTKLEDYGTAFDVTVNTANKTNIYWDGTSYMIQNNTASASQFYWLLVWILS